MNDVMLRMMEGTVNAEKVTGSIGVSYLRVPCFYTQSLANCPVFGASMQTYAVIGNESVRKS